MPNSRYAYDPCVRAGRGFCALVVVASFAYAAAVAHAQVPGVEPATPTGTGTTVALPAQAPTPKQVDGRIDDWRGDPSRFAGTTIDSDGELIYQDHLFDATGAASDQDATVFKAFDALGLEKVDPGLHRPTVTLYSFLQDSETYHYGAAPPQYAADLVELRVAADGPRVDLLARTAEMQPSSRTALLVLADTRPGSTSHPVPFGAGISSGAADVALLVSGDGVRGVDLTTGAPVDVSGGQVAVNPDGFTNAIEAALPRSLLSPDGHRARIAVATGTLGADGNFAPLPGVSGARLANVAFRTDEPVTPAFDREQALALHDGSIDRFFADIDLDRLAAGATERYVPGPGYHARTFQAPASVADEFANRGMWREYGVYLPAGFDPARRWSLTTFLHGSSTASGATNHGYAALLPGLFRDLGDGAHSIVIVPNDRQPRTPDSDQGTIVGFGDFMGESLVELETVWDDALKSFPVDPNRQYLSGYSQGGYAAYEIPPLMPDRFAAVLPIAGQVSSGDYIGVDFPGCETLHPPDLPPPLGDRQIDHGDACYPTNRPNQTVGPGYEAYGERHPDPRATNMLKVAGNLLHVPIASFSPLEDENQIYTANLAAARTFQQLGYRFRLYTFPAAEHQTPGLIDQWAEAARYLSSFQRDPNPAEVRFTRDMPLEREAELGTAKQANPNVRFDFDSAYWVSGLRSVDASAGQASIDARSFGIRERPHVVVPEVSGPATPDQTLPFAMAGEAWREEGRAPPARNAFSVTLTGARAVTLDLSRMRLSVGRRIAGTVDTQARLELGLSAPWTATPSVRVDGRRVAVQRSGDVVTVVLPPGKHRLAIG
jgi:hypothetical protein